MNIKGIIVRVTPFKEKSAMVNLLTEDKLISFLARDIFKINNQNYLAATPLLCGEFNFVDNNDKTLIFKEVKPIIDIRMYITDLNKLAAINIINELTLRLFNDEDMPSVYPYLLKALKSLNEINHISVILSYLAVSLKLNGYGLIVDRCIYDESNKKLVGVSYIDGGLVCDECFNKDQHLEYHLNLIKILQHLFLINNPNTLFIEYPIEDAKKIFMDLIVYAEDQTGTKFKSKGLI